MNIKDRTEQVELTPGAAASSAERLVVHADANSEISSLREPTLDEIRAQVDRVNQEISSGQVANADVEPLKEPQEPQPGHVEVAQRLGIGLRVLRETLLSAVNG